MQIKIIIFDKKIFPTTISCGEWLKHNAYKPIERVMNRRDVFVYLVNRRERKSRLSAFTLGEGVTCLIGGETVKIREKKQRIMQ